jgi:putative phosphoribosyl transferase
MVHKQVTIPIVQDFSQGELFIPENAATIIVFAHGSRSSRFSPRNKMVADYLQNHRLGTFLFDLLTTQEDADFQNRFNIELLAKRLVAATEWLQSQTETKGFYFGYFGAGTGAAAALIAASMKPQITAVVSRGGRPDLALESLPGVKAPTLLIVGSKDEEVLQLNQKAFINLNCEKKLEVVRDATHLFEEKGKMEEVCSLAANWFLQHLQPAI